MPVAAIIKRKAQTYRAAIITEVIQDDLELDNLLPANLLGPSGVTSANAKILSIGQRKRFE